MLFNVYMDGVVRDVNVSAWERVGAAECEWLQVLDKLAVICR